MQINKVSKISAFFHKLYYMICLNSHEDKQLSIGVRYWGDVLPQHRNVV